MRLVIAAAILALAATANTASANAQTYPDKPIHVIVPFTPGSATDVVMRAVAQAMSKNMGQTVVVDNKTGAGGTIGAAQVAKSAPDGYTLLANSSAHTVKSLDLSESRLRHSQGPDGREPPRPASQHHGDVTGARLEDRDGRR